MILDLLLKKYVLRKKIWDSDIFLLQGNVYKQHNYWDM